MVREIGDLDELPVAESSFIETGLDSLAMVSLSAQLQVEVGQATELPPTLLFDHPRVDELATLIVAIIEEVDQQKTPAPTSDPNSNSGLPANQNPNQTPEPDQLFQLRDEIEQMSEADALVELMKELD